MGGGGGCGGGREGSEVYNVCRLGMRCGHHCVWGLGWGGGAVD